MSFTATTATQKIAKLNKRIRAVCGGTSASKTVSILLVLIDYAQSHEGELISIVSESFPHLKRGVQRDFLNIMKEQGYYEYRDPGKDREDDGRYVYQDDYGNEKNLGLRMLPLLLLIIAGMAVFIVINRDVDSFKLLMNESEPEVTTTEEITATTEDKSFSAVF